MSCGPNSFENYEATDVDTLANQRLASLPLKLTSWILMVCQRDSPVAPCGSKDNTNGFDMRVLAVIFNKLNNLRLNFAPLDNVY